MQIFRALVLIAAVSGVAGAQGGAVNPQALKQSTQKRRETYTDRDRDGDAKLIVSWYGAHPAERPVVVYEDSRGGPGRGRGRGRGHAWAPGYEKKLVRAEVVPVEYREHIVPLPVAVVRTLPPVRSGWEYVIVGNRVVLVDKPTWKIVEIVVVL